MFQDECKHLILDDSYCSKCGALYYKGVRKIFFIMYN